MSQKCYFCNKNQGVEFRKLFNLRSKHSNKLIIDFIYEFQSHFVSERNLYDEFNWICSECLSRIYSYDWTYMRLKEQEKELRSLLLFTETKVRQEKTEAIDLQQNVTNIKIEDEIDIKPMIIMPQPIIIQPSLSTERNAQNQNKPNHNVSSAAPNHSVQNVNRSKPIIVRVVKRVPFLKPKLAAPVEQGRHATTVEPNTAITANDRPLKRPIQQRSPSERAIVVQSKKQRESSSENDTNDGIPIKCEYCGTVFSQLDVLQVFLFIDIHFETHFSSECSFFVQRIRASNL